MNTVAEALIAAVPWRELRAGPGTAAKVPEALAAAESDDVAAARYRLAELLVEIAGGETAQAEVGAGAADVAERCRSALREGLWTCYGLLGDEDARVRNQAITLLGWLEERPELIVPVLDRIAEADPDPEVRAAAGDLRAEY
ncbi:hypothetical protein [Amycolatopsis sacchari]|uniref:hypothetical protein n=1 Tax=Amycolatopsis sacchari TaxID=115433 RepID=UPI003D750844